MSWSRGTGSQKSYMIAGSPQKQDHGPLIDAVGDSSFSIKMSRLFSSSSSPENAPLPEKRISTTIEVVPGLSIIIGLSLESVSRWPQVLYLDAQLPYPYHKQPPRTSDKQTTFSLVRQNIATSVWDTCAFNSFFFNFHFYCKNKVKL